MNIDELRTLIRELIKTELDEINTTGTGTTISTGSSEAYATPRAFGDNKRKKKRGYMGYKEVK
mgnify:CR=1 FL=1|tara:strand:+ start:4122 stop:4310 length:189 start_codon:yes stop_codon:yes gene_type:complete